MAFSIPNLTGLAADQQLSAVDARIAQSTILGGNLFGTLGGARLSGLQSVFGGVTPLSLGAPAAFDFSQQMVLSLSQLSSGWSGLLGGGVAPASRDGRPGCH
ncbi:hypothetical protein IV102_05825 [bacterium]|nr:hypothetical protein [bacterium]